MIQLNAIESRFFWAVSNWSQVIQKILAIPSLNFGEQTKNKSFQLIPKLTENSDSKQTQHSYAMIYKGKDNISLFPIPPSILLDQKFRINFTRFPIMLYKSYILDQQQDLFSPKVTIDATPESCSVMLIL